MSRKTNQRLTFYAVLLAVIAGVYLAVHGYVTAPSGFTEFAASHAETLERAERLRLAQPAAPEGEKELLKSTPPPRTPRKPASAAPVSAEAMNQAVDQIAKAWRFDSTNAPRSLFYPLLTNRQTLLVDASQLCDSSGTLAPTPALARRIIDLMVMQAGLVRAVERYRNDDREPEQYDTATTVTAAMRSDLNRTLDIVEAFLIARTGSFSAPKDEVLNWALDSFASLALLRAARRPDPAQTARLIEGYLKAMRPGIITDAYARLTYPYYVHESLDHRNMKAAMIELAANGRFPAAALPELRRLLDAEHLTPAQFADLKTAWTFQAREQAVGRVAAVNFTNEDNRWHKLLWGFPEYLTTKALAPAAMRELDRAAMAVSGGDALKSSQTLARLARTAQLMNLREEKDDLCVALRRLSQIKRLGEADMRDVGFLGADLARLALGAAWFRQTRGRYPASIAELIPDAVDRGFAPTRERAWFVLPLPARHAPVYPSHDAAFRIALRDYIKVHHRAPTCAGDLVTSTTSPELIASWLVRFDDLPERPIIGLIQRIPDSWDAEFVRAYYNLSLERSERQDFWEISERTRRPRYAVTFECSFERDPRLTSAFFDDPKNPTNRKPAP